ncbi:hypothetical protein [Azospirillum thermophilum]|nr:hypothetical protein [Azospirillum thermophilum]
MRIALLIFVLLAGLGIAAGNLLQGREPAGPSTLTLTRSSDML